MRDPEEEDPSNWKPRPMGSNFVKLDGNVGCMVNGPACNGYHGYDQTFGRRTSQFSGCRRNSKCTNVEAFRIILKDPNVKVILINIFEALFAATV
jgi:succinyl-CoA synthetase beta subunit